VALGASTVADLQRMRGKARIWMAMRREFPSMLSVVIELYPGHYMVYVPLEFVLSVDGKESRRVAMRLVSFSVYLTAHCVSYVHCGAH
jgi:hypothetical protein